MNNWYVITGGPSTGKTTLLAELEQRGYTTLPEAARIVIDRAIAEGTTVKELRADGKKFQEIVLDYKVKIENTHAKDLLTFFDRGMHDTLAYLRLGAHTIEDYVEQSIRDASYKQVFLLEPLDTYTKDYARTETRAEVNKLNELLFNAFTEYGMKPILVPAMLPPERADFVLRHIK